MGKAIAWILSFTKVGKVAEPVQKWLSGKGTYLSGAALAIPAFITILQKFSEQGLPYFGNLMQSPEWGALALGIGMIRIRGAITKAADPSKDPNAPAA